MLCAVLYTRVKAGGAAPSQRLEKADCLHELQFISRLLSNEFIYSPEGLEANAERTFQSLETDQVILAEGTLVGLNPQERALGRENFDFFCFLLWPFIDTCKSATCLRMAEADCLILLQTGSPRFRSSPLRHSLRHPRPKNRSRGTWKSRSRAARSSSPKRFSRRETSATSKQSIKVGQTRGRSFRVARGLTALAAPAPTCSYAVERVPKARRRRRPADASLLFRRRQRRHLEQDGQRRAEEAAEKARVGAADGPSPGLGPATHCRRIDSARGQVVGVCGPLVEVQARGQEVSSCCFM